MSNDQALTGYRIGITSSRRADELATMLKRHGAVVESAPALMTLSCADDVQLRDATGACIEAPPDMLIANTGVGMRGWFDAATEWGLGAKLVESLRGCEILARGPKAGPSGRCGRSGCASPGSPGARAWMTSSPTCTTAT